MAQRRMISLSVIDTDMFLEMPITSRLLYYELCMRADDDGFVSSPKKILKFIGASEDDLKVLIAKNFVILFESGVIVIRHWRIHNVIQRDRYKETIYTEEKAKLVQDSNLVYNMETKCIQNGNKMETQVRLGKDSIGKDNIYSSKFTRPTLEEVKAYCIERKNSVDAEQFMNYYESNGWKVGKNAMKDWKAAVRTWEKNHQQDKPKELTTEERVKEMLKYEQR